MSDGTLLQALTGVEDTVDTVVAAAAERAVACVLFVETTVVNLFRDGKIVVLS